MIERYGIEWYEECQARNKARCKERYINDSEFRDRRKEYSKERYNNDSDYRESMKTWCKEHYQNDPEYRESMKGRLKERYQNDSEYRESMKTRNRNRYVEDGRIDLIENYDLAVKDNLKGWHIHHRLELHPDFTVRFMKQSLIKLDLYYNRPPSELIWLRRTEHKRMHNKAKTGN